MMSRVRGLSSLLLLAVLGLVAAPAHADTLLTIDEAQLIADTEARDGELYKMEFEIDDDDAEYEFKYLRRAAEVSRNVEIDATDGDVEDVGDRPLDEDDLDELTEILDAIPTRSVSFQQAADAALDAVGRGAVYEIKYDVRRDVSVMKLEIEDDMDEWDVIVRSADAEVLEIDGPPVDPEMFGFVDAVLAAEDAVRGGVAESGELTYDDTLDERVYTVRVLDPAQMLARVLRFSASDGTLIFDRTDPAEIENFMRLYDFYSDANFDLADSAYIAEAACPYSVIVTGTFRIRDGRLLGNFELADGFERPMVIIDTMDGEILLNECDDNGSMMIGFVDAVELAEDAVRGGAATEGELEFDDSLDERVYTVRVLDPAQMLERVLRYSRSTGELIFDRTDPDPVDHFDRIYNFITSGDYGLAETARIAEDVCDGNEILAGELVIRDNGLFGVFELIGDDDDLEVVVDALTGDVVRSDCDDDCDDPGLNPGLVRAINAGERECPDGDVLSAEFVTGDGRARYDVEVLALEPARIKTYQIKPGAQGRVLDQSERRVTDEEAPLLRQIYNLLPDVVLTWEEALIRARETYCEGQPRRIALDVSSDTLVYRVGIRQGHRTTYVLVDAATGRAGVVDGVLDERVRVNAGAADDYDLELDAIAGGNGLQTTYRTDRGVLVYLDYDAASGRWFATILNDRGETITEEAESDAFEDRKSGKRYVTVTTNAGFVLVDPEQDESQDRNLTDELPGATPIVEKQTTLITKDDLVVVAGLDYNGDLVAYFQTREVRADGEEVWAYVNLSRDHLRAQGLETPDFVGDLVGFVTPWNALNIAGLTADGDIWAAWWAPRMDLWYLSNLSELTGAAPMAGGLTAWVTEWGAINLAGVGMTGEVVVTWWVPGLDGGWRNNNLSKQTRHAGFTSGELTSYVTPWGGTNVAGVDDDGQLVVYSWEPGMSEWIVSPLSSLIQGAILPVGELTASTNEDGLVNLLGFSEDGDLIRYHWRPGGDWQMENTTEMLEPMR